MKGLTTRQQQCLDFIRSFTSSAGFPPTLREIANEMGIRSTNGVNDHLMALERKGFIVRSEMKSRAISVPGNEAPSDDAAVLESVLRASYRFSDLEGFRDYLRLRARAIGRG